MGKDFPDNKIVGGIVQPEPVERKAEPEQLNRL